MAEANDVSATLSKPCCKGKCFRVVGERNEAYFAVAVITDQDSDPSTRSQGSSPEHCAPHDDLVVPEDAPAWITPALIRETIETWQPFYRDSLIRDDAVTILTKLGRLFGFCRGDKP